jgi:hypothetical protein
MLPVERTLLDIGLLVSPQTCGGVRTSIYIEGDISPVFSDLQLTSAWTHPTLILMARF